MSRVDSTAKGTRLNGRRKYFVLEYRYSAVEVLNSMKMGQRWRQYISGRQQPLGSHVKFKSLQQKTKMPGAPKLQSLSKISIGQKKQLFMVNIFATLDFFVVN